MGYPASIARWASAIEAAAARYGLDPALLAALVYHESGGRADVVSSAGAIGLSQLMPATAAGLGVDPWDPLQNLDGGARYLRQQLDAVGGDPALALAAYNSGLGTVQRYGGIPPYPETQRYVQRVLATAAEIGPVASFEPPTPGGDVPSPANADGTGRVVVLLLAGAAVAATLLLLGDDE